MAKRKINNMQDCQCQGCSQTEEDCRCADCNKCQDCCDNPGCCGCNCPNGKECPDSTISNCKNRNKHVFNKVYQFTKKDKSGQVQNAGKMEIKNQTAESAELYFYGDIVGSTWESWWTDEDMCPQDVQDFLSQLENSQSIDIYINSGGGDVFGGIAIYNMLKRCNVNKTVHVDGLAASIASVIALAGDTVIIPSTAQFMIHNTWCFLYGGYGADDCRRIADCLDACSKSVLNVYKENLKDGVDINTIQELMDAETWMTGEEAAQYFNIQVEETASIAACANSEYFNKYKHTPKNLIPKPVNKTEKTDKKLEDKLNNIINRLDKLENPPKNEPKLHKNNEEIEKIKAKLALKCKL